MKIKFMSNEFDIVIDDNPYFQEAYRGHVVIDDRKIIIAKDDINKTLTLLHELIHLVDNSFRIGLSEDQVCQMESGLYHVLKENGMLKDFEFTEPETV